MLGRRKKILLIVAFAMCCCGCQQKIDEKRINAEENQTEDETIFQTANLERSVPNAMNFETQDAYEFLNGSSSISQDQYDSFVPQKLNQSGYVFGESRSFDGTIALTMLNIETMEYTDIYVANDSRTTVGVGCVSDKYMIYNILNQFEQYLGYYCLNLDTMESTLIYEIQDFNTVFDECAVICDDIAYLSLAKYEKNEETYEYPLFEYNMATKEFKILKNGMNGYPVIIKDMMYFIDIDNVNLETMLVQYDLKTKKESILAKGNQRDGYFTKLEVNGSDLLIEITRGYTSDIYKMDWDKHIIIPYITLNDMLIWRCSSGYLMWQGSKLDKGRVHPQYYFMDMQTNIVYHYNDAMIYFSDEGILWNEFLIKESEIPKGEIFKQGNSQMMWKSFNE